MRRSKLEKSFANAIEGRSKRTVSSRGQGFGQESKGIGEEMISRIHKQAGSKERESAEQKEDIDEVVNRQVETVDPTPTPAPTSEPTPTPAPAAPKVFKEISETVIDGLLAQREAETAQREAAKLEPIKAELATQKAEMARVQAELAAERDKSESLVNLGAKYGFATTTSTGTVVEQRPPQQVIVRSDGYISGADALKEYLDIRESSPVKFATSEAGFSVEHRDTRNSDAWLKKHRESIIQGLEARYQAAARGGKEAVTTRTDLTDLIMTTVSDMVRTNHHPAHIAANFIDYTIDIGRDSGNGITVPRYAFSEGSIDGSDWDLSNVTSLTTDAQPIQGSTVRIPVLEYGMGKPGLPTNRNKPIGINLFVNAISVKDILSVVSNNLGYNYRQFETATILYGLMNSTTTVYYNKKGEPTSTPASLTADDGGQCDWAFLTGLAAEMATQGVPAFANGKYALALSPKDLATLETSLRGNMQFLTRASITELTSIFEQSANNSDINYSGYKGDIGDFMIWDTATLGQGPFAAALAANTETINGTPTAMRTGFALGAHAMGRGVAMPFNIRESDVTDFQRQRILAWNSYEGFAALDLNASLSPVGTLVPQQTRVFKLRFTARAI